MSTVLVHLPPPMQKRAFSMMLARAMELRDQGEQVAVAHCALSAGTCSANVLGNRAICAACRYSTRKSVETTGLELIPLAAAPPDVKTEAPVIGYNELSQVADGVNSGLVTMLRILTEDLNHVPVLRKIKRRYFQSSLQLLASMHRILEQRSIDCVEVLNGRYACTKIGLIAARSQGRTFNTLDFNLSGKPMVFRGHTPHDRTAIQQRIQRNEPDHEIARRYYDGRKDRRFNKFAAAHRRFRPPRTDDSVTRRVTFYLSSQDECESLGPDWKSPFRNAATVIQSACERFPDYYFSVRFHPNQATIVSDVCSPFENLLQYSNVQLYLPTDDVDSYSLMEWSDVVVTFASTVAIEACWASKAVVQLGPSFFDQLQISYTPKTTEEFLQILAGPLKPHSAESAARFAAYETRDFDELQYLICDSTMTKPVGFSRRATVFAKPAKEVNTVVLSVIQKIAAGQLKKRPKAA
ncbi:MAG: hypothetical protein KDA96_19960 [Planctomycetaceae bacterium]|nr:hypothetical protein [Planctomycetaceae bacterium]